jgi:hypothetical protein
VIEFRKTYTNTVTVTLTENATISNPIYLFLFKNQQSGVNYYFIATDTSAFKQRYNQFQVIEKTNANTLNGEVSLDNEGFYDYTIYQTSLANTTGLANALAAVPFITKTVEVGLVWVVPDELQTTDYNPLSTTTIIYNPE